MTNNFRPKVTVALPVYNGSKHIKESIESILAQTFDYFDLVISDNNSSDNTLEICKYYASKDKRIIILENEKNIGATNNMNKLFDYSLSELPNNEYFNFIAHDDLWDEHYLEKTVSKIESDKEALICTVDVLVLSEDGQPQIEHSDRVRFKGIETKDLDLNDSLKKLWNTSNWFSIYGLYRVKKLKNIMPLPYVYGVDLVFLTRAVLNGHFISLNEKLFKYRMINKTSEDYQAIFFSDNKKVNNPFSETYKECVREIFNINASFKSKTDLLTSFSDIISKTYDISMIFTENKENVKEYFFKGLLWSEVTSNSYIEESNSLQKIKDISRYEKILEKFFEENNKESFDAILELIPINDLSDDIKNLIALFNLKTNNTLLSSQILGSLIRKKIDKVDYLNNYIVSEFKNNNFENIKDLFNKNNSLTSSKYIVNNLIKIFEFLDLDDYIQSICDINILQKLILKNSVYSEKTTVIVHQINNKTSIDSIFELLDKQTIKKDINLVLILDKSILIDLSNYISLFDIEYFDSSIGQNEFFAINNAISKSSTQYLTLVTPDLKCDANYFESAINFFKSLNDDTRLIYSNYRTNSELIYLESWNRKKMLEEPNNMFVSIFWSKKLHDCYGLFNELGTKEEIILDFILKISQTFNLSHFASNNVLVNEYTKINKEKYNNITNKYLEASNKNILLNYKKNELSLEILYDCENIKLDSNIENKFYIDFYLRTINLSKCSGKYIILCSDFIDIDNADIEFINSTYDQLWVSNIESKERLLTSGIDLNRIIIVDFTSISDINSNISNLFKNKILRENIDFYKNFYKKNIEELINTDKLEELEKNLYSLSKIDIYNYNNYLNLGTCQFKQNKFDYALDSLIEYIDYSDLNPDLCYMISVCLKNTGDIETSNEYYEKYLQLKNNS